MLTVKKVLEDLKYLKLVSKNADLTKTVDVIEISRPGLELTGYIEYFPYKRVQVFGLQEYSYLEKTGFCKDELTKFLDEKLPLIVFCRDLVPSKCFLEICEEKGIAVCTTPLHTSKLQTMLFSYLEYELAPETQVHGVLLSVFGQGVLIQGGSGIGKSEVALELINKGHTLIADDAVIIKKTDENTLIGTAPRLLKNRLEIRGVGIVDIQKLYGITKVANSKRIDLVLELKPLSGQEDRIGNIIKKKEFLGTSLPQMDIPVTIGRSVSNIIEVAVANFELKSQYGYDSAKEFVNDLNQILLEGKDG